jgi:predicted methyltransferase
MKSKLILAAAVAVLLSAGAAATQAATPGYIAAAVADKGRPEADVKRDADRKPAEMLEFAGVKPGMTVADFIPGGGYFTRIFAKAVGPKGVVYAVYPPPRPSTDPAKPTPTPAAETIAADPVYANVKPVKTLPATFALPTPADVIWTSQNYHDLHNVPNLDMAAVNKAIYAALKPGGVYIVLDHVATPGDPNVTKTLHRIDPAVVKQEVTAAGFKFEGESAVLKVAADDHTKPIFDPSLHDQTDRFIYKFRKPK